MQGAETFKKQNGRVKQSPKYTGQKRRDDNKRKPESQFTALIPSQKAVHVRRQHGRFKDAKKEPKPAQNREVIDKGRAGGADTKAETA
ncbi:hypothetical protein ACHAP5_012281 [Fusarium lateritium]